MLLGWLDEELIVGGRVEVRRSIRRLFSLGNRWCGVLGKDGLGCFLAWRNGLDSYIN